MVTPDAKREAVAHACEVHGVSQRRACEALNIDRSSVRYTSTRPDDATVARGDEGRGVGAAAVRLPADPHHAGSAGHRDEPEEAAAALPRGEAAGAPAWRPQAGPGHAKADARAGSRQRALEPRLRLRRLHRRAPLPGSGRGRRLHAGMPGAGRRHLAVRRRVSCASWTRSSPGAAGRPRSSPTTAPS